MKHSDNYIVSSCFSNAVQNASTPLGHNISFFRYEYSIDVMSYKLCDFLKLISPQRLSSEQCDSIIQIKQLMSIRSGSHYIEGFSYHDINHMIDYITTQWHTLFNLLCVIIIVYLILFHMYFLFN